MPEITTQDACTGQLAFAYIGRKLGIGQARLTSASRERPLAKARRLFAWITRHPNGSPPIS